MRDTIMEVNHDIIGDPYSILKILDSRIGKDGNIIELKDVISILQLMEEAKMLVDRCIFVNILRATRNRTILLKFVESGGWDTLYKWLQEARLEANKPLILELLKLYKHLPLTVTLLKQNNCAKDIRQLCKSSDDKIESLSKEIVDVWMLMVKENSSDLIKKADKQKQNSGVSSALSKSDGSDGNKAKDVIHSTSSQLQQFGSEASIVSHLAENNGENSLLAAADICSSSSDNVVSVIKDKHHRPKTVKMIGSKIRSTGLEVETPLLPASKKKISQGTHSHNSHHGKAVDNLVKKAVAVSTVSAQLAPTIALSTSSAAATSPTEQKGKIKLIPPKARVLEVFESSGFIDALSSTDYSVGKRKRKMSTTLTQVAAKSTLPATCSSPDDKKTVPSFYRDTLLGGDLQKVESIEATNDHRNVTENIIDNVLPSSTDADSKEDNLGPSLSNVNIKDDSTNEPPVKKKKTKSVSWAEESKLCSINYFQLDETERVNVNKSSDFAEIRRHEQERERMMMQNVKRMHDDSMEAKHQWRKPRLITISNPPVTPVCNSTEKKTQLEREQSVLQVLYFNKSMIPDSAAEAEIEFVEIVDPKIIPLNDETGTSGEVCNEYSTSSATSSSTGSLPSAIANLFSSTAVQSDPNNSTTMESPCSMQGPNMDPELRQNFSYPGMSGQNTRPYMHPMMFSEPGMSSSMQSEMQPMYSMGPMMDGRMAMVGEGMMPMMPPQRQPLLGTCPPQPFAAMRHNFIRNMISNRPPFIDMDMRRMQGPAMMGHLPRLPRGNQQICQHFQAGNCRYGDTCHHSHQISRDSPH